MKAKAVSDSLVEFTDDEGKVKFRIKVIGDELLIENLQGGTRVSNLNDVFGLRKTSQYHPTIRLENTGYGNTGPR